MPGRRPRRRRRRIAAWRAGFWPFAACRTLPRRMWSGTRPGQRVERLAHGVGAEVDRIDRGERAPVAPDRRTGSVDEDRGGVVCGCHAHRDDTQPMTAACVTSGAVLGQQMQGVAGRLALVDDRPAVGPEVEHRLPPGARRDADRDPAHGRRDDAVDVAGRRPAAPHGDRRAARRARRCRRPADRSCRTRRSRSGWAGGASRRSWASRPARRRAMRGAPRRSSRRASAGRACRT